MTRLSFALISGLALASGALLGNKTIVSQNQSCLSQVFSVRVQCLTTNYLILSRFIINHLAKTATMHIISLTIYSVQLYVAYGP